MTVGVGGFLLKGGINGPGGTALYGIGANNVVRYTTVDADGEVYHIDEHGVTRLDLDMKEVDEVPAFKAKDLFFSMRLSGPSYGVTTEFLYKVYERPGTYGY